MHTPHTHTHIYFLSQSDYITLDLNIQWSLAEEKLGLPYFMVLQFCSHIKNGMRKKEKEEEDFFVTSSLETTSFINPHYCFTTNLHNHIQFLLFPPFSCYPNQIMIWTNPKEMIPHLPPLICRIVCTLSLSPLTFSPLLVTRKRFSPSPLNE